jgi:hypothetical protein
MLVKEQVRLKQKFGNVVLHRIRTKVAGGFECEIKTPKNKPPYIIKFNRYPVSGGLDFLYAFKDIPEGTKIPDYVVDEDLRNMDLVEYLLTKHPQGIKGKLYEDKAWFEKKNSGNDLKQAVLAKAIRQKAEEAAEDKLKEIAALDEEIAAKKQLLAKAETVLKKEVSEAPSGTIKKKGGRPKAQAKVKLDSLV